MSCVSVDNSQKYDIWIEQGWITNAKYYEQTAERIRDCVGGQVAFVITDDVVDALYTQSVYQILTLAGYRIEKFVIAHGEESKNANNYIAILNALASKKLTRTDCIVALGGGVVGDLAGFVAATYLRGIAYVQIPTTLLAMVDSSVGGKTAIDLEAGKNLAGAFYQPRLVICDSTVLATLPQDIFRDGCAEIIKYGILEEEALFERLYQPMLPQIDEIIHACVSIKRDYVCQDEFDKGLRQKLNLGHTVGHAIEACSQYTISHGTAVAMGMACIADIALHMGLCSTDCQARIEKMLLHFGYPVEIPYESKDLFATITSDKKLDGGTLSLIVPREIGVCEIYKLSLEEFRVQLEEYIRRQKRAL